MATQPSTPDDIGGRLIYFGRVGLRSAVSGSRYYYAWLAGLALLLVLGLYTYAQQLHHGLIITSARHLSPWATLSYAQFPFFDGIAAGVIVVIALATVYGREDFEAVNIFAWALAGSAAVVSIVSVLSMLGSPLRLFYLMPIIGTPNFPASILTWDALVLNVFILLCLAIPGYGLYKGSFAECPDQKVRYLTYLAVVWAIVLQAVVAAILIVNPARDLWFTALMAPRFITSAVAAGAAAMVLILLAIARIRPVDFDRAGIEIRESVLHTLGHVVILALVLNLFSLFSEIFTLTWPGTSHGLTMQYLLFGLEHQGEVYNLLTPVMWLSLLLEIGAVLVLIRARTERSIRTLTIGSAAAFAGVFFEKGIIIFVSAFIVSPLGEVYEPAFTVPEVVIAVSLWALGALIFTLLAKAAIGIRAAPQSDFSMSTLGD